MSGAAISRPLRNWLDTLAFDRDMIGRETSRGLDNKWRKAVRTAVANPRTYRVQRIDQIADRPLSHARGPVEFITATGKGQCGRQRTKRGTGISEKQTRFCELETVRRSRTTWSPSSLALNSTPSFVSASSITRVSSASSKSAAWSAVCQRRQQQHAIGNTFGTGQTNRASGAVDWVNGEDGRPSSHAVMMPRCLRSTACHRPQQKS